MSDEMTALSADSCLNFSGKAPDDTGDGLSLAEAFDATMELDTISAEKLDAVDGITNLPVYRRYQARGVTAKSRNKSNIFGITMHTPEGYESGTLSVLSGTRAGFDDYLPLNGRYYPCNDISRYFTWHSGHSWGNPHCIGIEQGDFAANSGKFGDAHYLRLARLCAYYCEIYELSPKHVNGAKPGIMSHASLTPASRTDPGASFRWDDLMDMISDYLRGTGPSPKPSPAPKTPTETVYRITAGGKQTGAYSSLGTVPSSGALNEVAKQLQTNDEVRVTRGK